MSKSYRDIRIGSKEIYNKFCELNPETKFSHAQYKEILLTYNKAILEHILETGEIVQLPWGIGGVSITKFKCAIRKKKTCLDTEMYNYNIDWKETKKQGKYVYHLNLHTGGFRYKWYWSPKSSRIKFSGIWELLIWRTIKRELPRRLKIPNSKYKDLYRTRRKRYFKEYVTVL